LSGIHQKIRVKQIKQPSKSSALKWSWIGGEGDKIRLDGPDLMGLMDPVSWAVKELVQLSLRPIVDRYSNNPG